jgi:predicted transcriptional regulator
MPNRSQEENDTIILNALRKVGDSGMSVDEIRQVLFGDGEQSKSLTKKLLERLKSKGHIRVKMGRSGLFYVITSGH